MLISLTYMSTATVAFGRPELFELLERSRARNHAAGLTGMLLYAGGHFIQTLEGSPGEVDATFSRIERDSRHRSVSVTLREEVDQRYFGAWSMGFEELDAERRQPRPGVNNFMGVGRGEPEVSWYGRAGVFHRIFRDKMR